MINRILLTSLVVAFPLAKPIMAETIHAAPPACAEQVSAQHCEWTRLLEAYVVPNADGVTRFDYGALQANTDDRAKLDAYIAAFTDTDLSATTNANFATWANLYNAITVRYIVEKYPLDSIRDGYIVGPWKRIKTVIGGETVSLDDIEHQILRPRFEDPRVHYAVNCASYGCPNLMPQAWEAATLDDDLDAAARAYVNHARGVTVTAKGLTVSNIYKWFQDDFGGSKAGVVDHLLTYAEPDLAEAIRANPKIRKYQYDWSLNDITEGERS